MTSKVQLHKQCRIGKVEKNLFGSFIEHMGRAVYGGIYDPNSRYADENGFRKDVIKLVKELGISLVRYPGGNFLSGYDWTDGIGRREERPARLDLAWMQLEPNSVGLHEFGEWASLVGSPIMMAANMGTGTPKEAMNLLEYCNHPSGTAWSEKRIKNGKSQPFSIEYWCLGNEMDGDWQICSLKAEEYGRKAHETAKLMKWLDSSVKLTVCGSSGSTMDTYPEWDRIVLEHTYDNVEYLSLHKYYEFPDFDKTRVSDYLASFVDFNAFIKTGKATIEYVKALKRSKKQVYLSVDEWNIWHTKEGSCPNDNWTVGARRLENKYTALDAVVFSSLMMTLINNADAVKMACLAQLVNVIAPIFVDGEQEALKQSIFHPFKMGSKYAKGEALVPFVETDTYEAKPYGTTPYLYVASTYEEESGETTVFLVNNRFDSDLAEISLSGFENPKLLENYVLKYDDLFDVNTFEERDKVSMSIGDAIAVTERGTFIVRLPAVSFSVVRFAEKR